MPHLLRFAELSARSRRPHQRRLTSSTVRLSSMIFITTRTAAQRRCRISLQIAESVDLFWRAQLGGGKCFIPDANDVPCARVRGEKSADLVEERLYIGAAEIFRRKNGSGQVQLERQTLRVFEEKGTLILIDTRTVGTDDSPAATTRYQFGDHHGSSTVEVDENAALVSYEVYYAYGATAYQGVRSATEVPQKRYRYLGKERDEETGFIRCGLRLYAPWLALGVHWTGG